MIEVRCEIISCKKNQKGICTSVTISLVPFGKYWDESGNEYEYDAAIICEQFEEK